MILNNIEFYDRNGLRQSGKASEGLYKFELEFEPVSTDLYSTQQVHILEKAINVIGSDVVDTLIPPRSIEETSIKISVKGGKQSPFFIYTLNHINGEVETTSEKQQLTPDLEKPWISKAVDFVMFDLVEDNPVNSREELTTESESYINQNNIREIIRFSDSIDAPTINIGFVSKDSGIYKDNLLVYSSKNGTDTLIAEIRLYAEAEAKDERFVTILQNFGKSLTVDDSLVFRDTDVNEDLPDNIAINEKSKELILEFQNIIPFVGSYKGLINALKYYGYSDLRLKEWWLNISSEKFLQIGIDTETFISEKTSSDNFNNNKKLRKTGKFSLFYDINKPTGENDENGIPELENAFDYSHEEVIIKLFGLKRLLKEKYLPLSTRIVDIVGEGITFNRISTTSWNGGVVIQEINSGKIDIEITADPITGELDKKRHGNYLGSSGLSILQDSYNKRLSDIANTRIDASDKFSEYYDSPNRKSYRDVILTNKTLQRDWKDSGKARWNELSNITWNDIGPHPFYEIEWIISGSNDNPFYKKIKGDINEFTKINIDVDISGEYDVTVYMRDLYNNVYVNRYPRLFSIELPEPNFGMVYCPIINIQTWKDAGRLDYKWSESHYSWTRGNLSNQKWKDADSTWKALDPRSYMGQESGLFDISFEIDSIDRNSQKVKIKRIPTKHVDMFKKQTFLTLSKESITQESTTPISIRVADNTENYIVVEDGSGISSGQNIETFRNRYFENPTIVGSEITVPDYINVYNGIKILIGQENGKSTILTISGYKADRRSGTTTFTLKESEDELFGMTVDYVYVCWDFRSFVCKDVVNTPDGKSRINLDVELQEHMDSLTQALSFHSIGILISLSSGRYSIPILNVDSVRDEETNLFDITIQLKDTERELFRIDTDFKAIATDFDITPSLTKSGRIDQNWNDFENTTWKQATHLNWDVCELWPSYLTGFTITDISENGTISINESSRFSFSSRCTGNVELALEEIKSSDIPELMNYDYMITGSDITAVSKTWGEDTIAVIETTGKLKTSSMTSPRYATNYPLPGVVNQESDFRPGSMNNKLVRDRLIRYWDYIEENPDIPFHKSGSGLYFEDDFKKTFKYNMSNAVNGNFRWNNIKFGSDSSTIPNNTLCFFYGDISNKIIGKSGFEWRIYKDSTGDLIGKSKGEYFSYLFKERGSYSIELEVTDNKKNKSSVKKNSMVSVY